MFLTQEIRWWVCSTPLHRELPHTNYNNNTKTHAHTPARSHTLTYRHTHWWTVEKKYCLLPGLTVQHNEFENPPVFVSQHRSVHQKNIHKCDVINDLITCLFDMTVSFRSGVHTYCSFLFKLNCSFGGGRMSLKEVRNCLSGTQS